MPTIGTGVPQQLQLVSVVWAHHSAEPMDGSWQSCSGDIQGGNELIEVLGFFLFWITTWELGPVTAELGGIS